MLNHSKSFLRFALQSKALKYAILMLAVAHLLWQPIKVFPDGWNPALHNADAQVYYEAAKDVWDDHSLYEQLANVGPDHVGVPYIYLPYFAAFVAPLGLLSLQVFSWSWLILLLVAFWAFAWCLAKLFRGKKPVGIGDVLIWGLIIGLWPGSYPGVIEGNINAVLWALMAAGLVLTARPSLWAIASLIKPFCMWAFIADAYDRWKEQGAKVLLRSLIPAVAIGIALFILGGVVCGWSSYMLWLHSIAPSLSQGTFKLGNISLSVAVLRFARYLGWNYTGGVLPPLAHYWLTAASIVGPLFVWWLLRKAPSQIKYASIIAASALFSPICWIHYLPFLLPPFAVLLKRGNAFLQDYLQVTSANIAQEA